MSEKKREEILAEIKEKGIYEKDVKRGVLVLKDYLNGKNVRADNSELLPWVIRELIGEFIAVYNKYAFDGEEALVRPEDMPPILGVAEFEGATLKEKKAVTEDELEAAVKVVEDYFSRRVSAEGEKLSEGKQSIVQRLFKSVLGSSLANIKGDREVPQQPLNEALEEGGGPLFTVKDLKGDYKNHGISLHGQEFTSRYAMGDIVYFAPGNSKDSEKFIAMVTGLIIIGPKVAYQLLLETGANVRTFGERVVDYPHDNIDADIKEFFKEALADTSAGF